MVSDYKWFLITGGLWTQVVIIRFHCTCYDEMPLHVVRSYPVICEVTRGDMKP